MLVLPRTLLARAFRRELKIQVFSLRPTYNITALPTAGYTIDSLLGLIMYPVTNSGHVRNSQQTPKKIEAGRGLACIVAYSSRINVDLS